MGRSVSVPRDTVNVCYREMSEVMDEFGYEWIQEWIQDCCREGWPSMYDHECWASSEDKALSRNDHVEVGYSTYCGLVSIWMRVRDDAEYPGLAERWAINASKKFDDYFGQLVKVGTFSNGNAVFARKETA